VLDGQTVTLERPGVGAGKAGLLEQPGLAGWLEAGDAAEVGRWPSLGEAGRLGAQAMVTEEALDALATLLTSGPDEKPSTDDDSISFAITELDLPAATKSDLGMGTGPHAADGGMAEDSAWYWWATEFRRATRCCCKSCG
jgi:hypothetical protein